MKSLIYILNHPKEALNEKHLKSGRIVTLLSILCLALIDPLLNSLINHRWFRLSIHCFYLIVIGCLAYTVYCITLWGLGMLAGRIKSASKDKKSVISLKNIMGKWGITMPPTLLCCIITIFAENYYYIFWQSRIYAILLSVLLIGILFWKAILYVLFLKQVLLLSHKKLIAVFLLEGIIILVLAFIELKIGLKVPII